MPPAADPFEQLLRSHLRLKERLAHMKRAAADLGGAKDQLAREYLEESLEWIDRAVRRHESDEEASLFPRLSGVAALAPAIATLTEEHRVQEALARKIHDALAGANAEVAGLVAKLADAYARHIVLEEEDVFPKARAALDTHAQAEMQAEMEARRGRG